MSDISWGEIKEKRLLFICGWQKGMQSARQINVPDLLRKFYRQSFKAGASEISCIWQA
jgi:hypothetical protein